MLNVISLVLEVRKVDVEAHFFTNEYVKALYTNKGYPRYDGQAGTRRLWFTSDSYEPHGDFLFNKLLDLEDGRLKDMDTTGIDVQVLSLSSPGLEQLDASVGVALAKSCNDELSKVVKNHPDRFIGLAALAPKRPSEAADELQRAVKDLGLRGWKTQSNYGDSYLDAKKYWPILSMAEKLDVPIFLHPVIPAIDELRTYGYALAGPPFGFGFETAMCMMRLMVSGVLDKYPKLKIILGHLGEGMPFNLSRMDFMHLRPWLVGVSKSMKKPSEYFKNNIWVNTSGNFHQPAVTCTYQALGADRMLFGADYPYEDMTKAVQNIEESLISEEDKEKIYYINSKKLLRFQY